MSYDVDECETYAIYDEILRRARKEHRCSACHETIKIKDQYYVINTVCDGSAISYKRCLRCQMIHEHLRELSPGELWPDERLNCGTSYKEHWDREPPLAIQALAFITPNEMQDLNKETLNGLHKT